MEPSEPGATSGSALSIFVESHRDQTKKTASDARGRTLAKDAAIRAAALKDKNGQMVEPAYFLPAIPPFRGQVEAATSKDGSTKTGLKIGSDPGPIRSKRPLDSEDHEPIPKVKPFSADDTGRPTPEHSPPKLPRPPSGPPSGSPPGPPTGSAPGPPSGSPPGPPSGSPPSSSSSSSSNGSSSSSSPPPLITRLGIRFTPLSRGRFRRKGDYENAVNFQRLVLLMLLHLGDQHGGSYSVAEVKNFLSEDLYDYFDTPWKSLKKKIWHIEWNHNLHRRVWGSENDEVIHVIYSKPWYQEYPVSLHDHCSLCGRNREKDSKVSDIVLYGKSYDPDTLVINEESDGERAHYSAGTYCANSIGYIHQVHHVVMIWFDQFKRGPFDGFIADERKRQWIYDPDGDCYDADKLVQHMRKKGMQDLLIGKIHKMLDAVQRRKINGADLRTGSCPCPKCRLHKGPREGDGSGSDEDGC